MKKLILVVGVAAVVTACDGDVVKSAARAILADEIQQPQQAQSHNGQMQPVQSMQQDGTVMQLQVDQYGQPIQPQYGQMQDGSMQQPVDMQALPAKPVPRVQAPSERVVRKRAYVLTQHGSNVMVRRAPSRSAGKIGYLYDGENIWVVGETNKCQTINGLYGCWVKVVDANGLTGYSFGAYLRY